MACIALGSAGALIAQDEVRGGDREFLRWTRDRAESVGQSMRVKGRVGGIFGLRGLHTERSYNYELRATWLTPEVIRATARLAQLSDGLTDDQTEALVREAVRSGDVILLVEIDPREGSGVIPLDWVALLQPKGATGDAPGAVKGESVPQLRTVRALSGVFRRDYDYEQFWVVFPARGGAVSFLAPGVTEAELVVRIFNKEGRVAWRIPESVRRLTALRPGAQERS